MVLLIYNKLKMIFKLLQAKGSVESVVAINLRSIFWCKITPARGMSLTGMVGYQP